MSEVAFHQRSQCVESVEIHEKVYDANVYEHGCEEPPNLPLHDELIYFGPERNQHAHILCAVDNAILYEAVGYHNGEEEHIDDHKRPCEVGRAKLDLILHPDSTRRFCRLPSVRA